MTIPWTLRLAIIHSLSHRLTVDDEEDAAIKIFPSASTRPQLSVAPRPAYCSLSAIVPWKKKKRVMPGYYVSFAFTKDAHLYRQKLQITIISLIPGKRFTVEYSRPSTNGIGRFGVP